MAGQLRWVLVLILVDTVFSTPGLVMVREEGVVVERERREVREEESERWRRALRSEGVSERSDGIEEIEEMEEMEERWKREVGAETGKRIKIKSNDQIAPTVRCPDNCNDVIDPILTV